MSSKSIKTEPVTEVKAEVVKSVRLPSFGSTRDLSLGGNRNQRTQVKSTRVYTPNLNAVRNKNNDTKSDRDSKNGDRGRGDRGRKDRGAFNGRGGRKIIQTLGVFSEGTAAAPPRKSENYGSGSSRDANIEVLRRPTIIKREFKVDADAEQKQLSDLIGEDGDSDDMTLDDSKSSSDSDILPIKILDLSSETSPISRIIKTEPGLEVKSETFDDATNSPLDQLLNSTQSQLFLFQLPDTLPGRIQDSDDYKKEKDEEKTEPSGPRLCTLDHFQEGLIGKIVRYRSGKTKLILGETLYDIDLGLNTEFLQDVVSITTNREERSGSMFGLGQIKSKLNVTPDWEHLFHKLTP
ncbi:unnamed protein product [Diamesa tonsa]